ncbi:MULTISPECIES: helix-turn-helix domain-containing protein [Clostridium]|uniref:helix-turn-helix domain-containing protein n=1 Tax=Clostridium TaxID=1485 RepID=UPI0032EE66D2
MKKEVAEKLQSARKTLGFTQDYVANKLGISRIKIINIEKGEAKVDIELLNKFSSLYGYSLEYFICDNTNKSEDISFAFRSEGITEKESEILAWGNKILSNVKMLNEIIKEANI